MKTYDNIIIGFGQGPKALVGSMKANGESVVLIEASRKMYGGTCFNVGCIPTKKLLYLSQQPTPLSKKDYYHQSIMTKMAALENIHDVAYHMISDPGGELVNGVASFVNNHEVKVTSPDGSTENYQAKRIIIDTGSTPVIPNIPGMSDCKWCYTSATLMDLETLPDRLAIIGGGNIGLEFATIYNNFGSNVTVIEEGETFMPHYDRQTAQAVWDELEAEGIRIIMGAKVSKFTNNPNDVTLSADNGDEPFEITTDAVLVATGRKPNIDRLELENTTIEYDSNGIHVNDVLETSVPGVYAIGDVKGSPMFTYISLSDNKILANQFWGDKTMSVSNQQSTIPVCLFLNTPLSTVGLTEEQAVFNGYKVQTAKIPTSGTLKTWVTGDKTGFIQVVINSENNQILGATLYTIDSFETINLITLAMTQHLDYHVLQDLVYTHPIASEMLYFLFNSIPEKKSVQA